MPEPNEYMLDLAEHRDILTVSELTGQIKLILEGSFAGIWVEGEISNYKKQLSGHAYFTLKDDNSQINAVIWRTTGARLKFTPENGQKVIVFGRITVYGPRGQYQVIVDKIEPQGIGALTIAFEKLKKKLAAEGLFDEEKKKPIPFLPEKIGIVTSPTGAAIRDILNILQRRFATAEVIIHPVRVQGDLAKEEIAAAIADFNKALEVDVIVLARGGGSLEDLWAFNEEIVARAIAASARPVISAIGHEVDWTISDFVSDFRAPTPSAAAELVLPEKDKLRKMIEDHHARLKNGLRYKLSLLEEKLERLKKHYVLKRPCDLIDEYLQRIDEFSRRIQVGCERVLEIKEADFKDEITTLEALSPLKILMRGYSITYKAGEKKSLRNIAALAVGDKLLTRIAKGSVTSKITEIKDG